jgi:hypothetical protein
MDYAKLGETISELLTGGTKNTLKSVFIAGNGEDYYFDTIRKSFILIKKQSEMYYLPIEEDENGHISLFLPYIFGSSAIILVPKDDVIFIGDN